MDNGLKENSLTINPGLTDLLKALKELADALIKAGEQLKNACEPWDVPAESVETKKIAIGVLPGSAMKTASVTCRCSAHEPDQD